MDSYLQFTYICINKQTQRIMKTKEQTFENYVKETFNRQTKDKSDYQITLEVNKALKEYHNSLNSIRRSIIDAYNENKLPKEFCPLKFDIVLNMKKPEVYNYIKDNVKKTKKGYNFFYVLRFLDNNLETLQGLK